MNKLLELSKTIDCMNNRNEHKPACFFASFRKLLIGFKVQPVFNTGAAILNAY